MRYIASLIGLAIVIGMPAPAFALEHGMKVGEVLVSKNGDTTIQYIELQDAFMEPFMGTYRLEVYDAANTFLGMVALTVPANTQRLFIATVAADTAFGTTRDATLPATLPANGQACFLNANAAIHCVAWGCITAFHTGAQRAPSPPDNQSVSMQSNLTFQVTTPTPDAANVTGTVAVNCPTDPIDAGVTDGNAGDGPRPDAPDGTNPNDGGCCRVDQSGGFGTAVLALAVLLVLSASSRRRRRP